MLVEHWIQAKPPGKSVSSGLPGGRLACSR
jgi:hypothetical protein